MLTTDCIIKQMLHGLKSLGTNPTKCYLKL